MFDIEKVFVRIYIRLTYVIGEGYDTIFFRNFEKKQTGEWLSCYRVSMIHNAFNSNTLPEVHNMCILHSTCGSWILQNFYSHK